MKKNATTAVAPSRRQRRRMRIELTPATWSALKVRAARESEVQGVFVSMHSLAVGAVEALLRGALRS
jgi:hypothetical protein